MYAIITRLDDKNENYEVTPETYQAMKGDFGTDLTKIYDTLPEGKIRIDWKDVKRLDTSDTDPYGIVVVNLTHNSSEDSMSNW